MTIDKIIEGIKERLTTTQAKMKPEVIKELSYYYTYKGKEVALEAAKKYNVNIETTLHSIEEMNKKTKYR